MGFTKIHFVGVGGIGMSGLAAMCQDRGMAVTGSDRGADRPENQRIIGALRRQGIRIYPQDGSYVRDGKPEVLVYSTAIEENNPDFAAGIGIPRMHRSQLLAELLNGTSQLSIAVTGSCGKSSVTAYLAEALDNLGTDPACLNGALIKRFISGTFAGNYRPGRGKYLVFEADESDKSLLNYGADYALILNMGTDHYDREELARVFGTFLQSVRKGAVLERQVFEAVQAFLPKELPVAVFDAIPGPGRRYALEEYQVVTRVETLYDRGTKAKIAPSGDRAAEDARGASNFLEICGLHQEDFRIERRVPEAVFTGGVRLTLPQSGRHTAWNALAIFALLEMLGFEREAARQALERFDGVWRRTDFAGMTAQGAAVYDDYAHNPEKILSCIQGMRETVPGRVLAVFQPHGYGPFGFMRDQLFLYLEKELKPQDRFFLLEPYYAGGTSSFKPSAAEVMADWRSRSRAPERFALAADRDSLKAELLKEGTSGDVIVIMGARDNSLSDYAASLAAPIRE